MRLKSSDGGKLLPTGKSSGMYKKNSRIVTEILSARMVAVLIIAMISTAAVVDATQGSLQGSSGRLEGGPPPEDYVTYPGYDNIAYKYHREALLWEEAQELCESEGANLAIADSVTKIMLLRSIQTKENGSLHVGIHRPESGEDWVRVDKDVSLTSLPWALDSRQDSDLRCAAAQFRGLRMHLIRVPCDDGSPFEFFCEIPVPLVRQEQAPIPEGYRQSSIYNVAIKHRDENDDDSHRSWSWNEAQEKCKSEGANLLIAETEDEINQIRSDLSIYPFDDVYVGIRRFIYVGIRRSNTSEDWLRVDNNQKLTSVSSIPEFRESTYDCTKIGIVNEKVALIPVDCDEPLSEYQRQTQRNTFVCQVTTTQVLPESYVIFPDSDVAYKLHGDSVTQYEAINRCGAEGGNLAKLGTLEMIDRIRSLQMNYKSPLHVGSENQHYLYAPCVTTWSEDEPLKSHECATFLASFACEILIRQDL